MYHRNFKNADPVEVPGIAVREPAEPPEPGVVAAVIAKARASVVRMARRRRFIREFRRLVDLPDRHLRDIGMHRGDITDTKLRELLKDPANWDV